MFIFFIVIFIVLISATMFILGTEVSEIKKTKFLEDLMVKLSKDDSEKETWEIRYKSMRELLRNNIFSEIFATVLMGFMLYACILGYRDENLDQFKRGKIAYEEVVHIKTNGDEVKTDTTYNFYRIKPEKK